MIAPRMIDRFDVDAELRRRGLTYKAIGARLGLTGSYIRMVMRGVRRSDVVLSELSYLLGIGIADLTHIIATAPARSPQCLPTPRRLPIERVPHLKYSLPRLRRKPGSINPTWMKTT